MSETASSHLPEHKRPLKQPSGYSMGDSVSLILTDPNTAKHLSPEEKHPWFRLFDQGKDSKDRDLNSTLEFLKLARSFGKTKIRPDEDKAPGLIVTFRGIELTPNADRATYTLRLLGEFNASEVLLTAEQTHSLFAGKMTQWELTSETSRSTGSTRYIVKTDLAIRLSMENKILKIYSMQGTGTITTIGFLSKETYVSPKVQLGDPDGIGVLFEGRPGPLPQLPLIK